MTANVTAIERRRSDSMLAAFDVARPRLPRYVMPGPARDIINAAKTNTHRLLLECLWQSGGRITEVLRLRPADVDHELAALRMLNLKQRTRDGRPKPSAAKRVYVSRELVAQLRNLAADARLGPTDYFFRSSLSGRRPMHRSQAWRIVQAASEAAGVWINTSDGPRLAAPRDFRHGAAVNQIRQGVPVSEVQQQLGHADLSTTGIYLRLADPERRAIADGVQW